jgi:hypothetical protein
MNWRPFGLPITFVGAAIYAVVQAAESAALVPVGTATSLSKLAGELIALYGLWRKLPSP